jgi:choline transport protein
MTRHKLTLLQVDYSTGLPKNSLLVTFMVTFCLAWIAAGSTIAFNSIISISLVGLLLSYGTVIVTIAIRRSQPEPLPPSFLKWPKVVGYGLNIFALCYLIIAFIFVFFPVAPNPDAASMNWSIVIAGGVILFAAIYYVVRAKRTYTGPVTRIKKREEEAVTVAITSGFQKSG